MSSVWKKKKKLETSSPIISVAVCTEQMKCMPFILIVLIYLPFITPLAIVISSRSL
jgi:hypothetical protein